MRQQASPVLNSGCLPFTTISGKSGWEVNGIRLFGRSIGKFPGARKRLKR